MCACRMVQSDSQRGSSSPLKNADGLYNARLRAKYRWKLSLPCAWMSLCERSGKCGLRAGGGLSGMGSGLYMPRSCSERAVVVML